MLAKMLNKTCVVQQATITESASMGSPKRVYSERISSVKCASMMKTKPEGDEYGKTTVRTIQRFYMAATSATLAIENSDRIIYNSKTFEIHAINNVGERDMLLQIDTVELV